MAAAARRTGADDDAARRGHIAAEAGYESDAAFNRAFKRLFGTPPARYRREHRATATPDAAKAQVQLSGWVGPPALSAQRDGRLGLGELER